MQINFTKVCVFPFQLKSRHLDKLIRVDNLEQGYKNIVNDV